MKNLMLEVRDWAIEFLSLSILVVFCVMVALSAVYLFEAIYYGGI